MKKIIVLFSFSLLAFISCNRSDKYELKAYLSDKEKDSVLVALVPYFAEIPYEVKSETENDAIKKINYERVFFNWSLEKYYKAEDSMYYFMIWEIAPSIQAKEKIAIGGRYQLDKQKKVINFEEIFNTPKMLPEALKEKTSVLFEEMISKKGDMSKYIGNAEMIEFPDAHVCYDKKVGKWKVCVPYN